MFATSFFASSEQHLSNFFLFIPSFLPNVRPILHSFWHIWQGAASFHLRPAGMALWDWYKIELKIQQDKPSDDVSRNTCFSLPRWHDIMIFISSDSCSCSMFRIQNPDWFFTLLGTLARPWPGYSDVSWSAAIPCSEQAAGSTPLLLSANDAPPQSFSGC